MIGTPSRASTPCPTIEPALPRLADAWRVSLTTLERYWADLRGSQALLSALNAAIDGVPQFAGTSFTHVNDLRVYRCMLYLFTRAVRPRVFVETGVLHGFSSTFILLAMQHNDIGRLHSIDIPPDDPEILAQGTTPLPTGQRPGWVIPPDLRDRHELLLGRAERVLPTLLGQLGEIDAFLHDSDHRYAHMMFELALAWEHVRPGGWILCDNIEQNLAFQHFVDRAGGHALNVASFETTDRVWRHGLVQKPATFVRGATRRSRR